ncbi:hypothetical protein [Crateriforma conspicua]|nr:hypothetical protein [Crateriforma conspicua]QDV61970.1 hypothetical protein Mal65_10980 [Crateriforma conspicua]
MKQARKRRKPEQIVKAIDELCLAQPNPPSDKTLKAMDALHAKYVDVEPN